MLRDKSGVTLVGLIVALIVILAIGFGIYRIFFVTKPLKIKDLEDMYLATPRSSLERGWTINVVSGEADNFFGQAADNSNEYMDGLPVERFQKVGLLVDQARVLEYDEVNIQAGDRVELTYDGGRKLLVYLPRITGEDLIFTPEEEEGSYGFALYVASDGSTYYDKKLTQLAQAVP